MSSPERGKAKPSRDQRAARLYQSPHAPKGAPEVFCVFKHLRRQNELP